MTTRIFLVLSLLAACDAPSALDVAAPTSTARTVPTAPFYSGEQRIYDVRWNVTAADGSAASGVGLSGGLALWGSLALVGVAAERVVLAHDEHRALSDLASDLVVFETRLERVHALASAWSAHPTAMVLVALSALPLVLRVVTAQHGPSRPWQWPSRRTVVALSALALLAVSVVSSRGDERRVLTSAKASAPTLTSPARTSRANSSACCIRSGTFSCSASCVMTSPRSTLQTLQLFSPLSRTRVPSK